MLYVLSLAWWAEVEQQQINRRRQPGEWGSHAGTPRIIVSFILAEEVVLFSGIKIAILRVGKQRGSFSQIETTILCPLIWRPHAYLFSLQLYDLCR